MKAMVMTAPGGPEVLQEQQIPQPTIQDPHDVLIAIKAAGINPIDTKLRSRGTFYPDQMPAILGCDGAGVVVASGEAVTQWQPGTEVYYCAGGLGLKNTGNYAEYTLVPDYCLAPKPPSLSWAEAAAVPLALITAWESLYDRAQLQAGQKVLIHGGAGGVGHLAIQLAKLVGAEVITTVSTPDQARLARQLGADETILYEQQDFREAVLSWTKGVGVDVGFDTVGGLVFFETCQVVKVYGDVVTILEPDSSLGNLKVARERNLRLSLELMLTPALKNLLAAQRHQQGILVQAGKWLEEGKLKIHLSQSFPLSEVAAAHRAIASRGKTGKIALIVS